MREIILFSAISAYKFIYLYTQNITRISPLWALCFILGAMALFIGLFWYFKIALKDRNKSIIVSLIVMCFLSLNIEDVRLVPVFATAFFILAYLILKYFDPKKVLAFLKPFGITLLLLAVLNGTNIWIKTFYTGQKPLNNTEENKNIKTPNRNIYIILLDAHAGSRTLGRLGGSADDFFNKLRQRGFTVFENMESNYNRTVVSIPSFLNAAYINDLDFKTPSEAISNAKLFKLAKNAGYKIYYLNSWPMDITIKTGVIDNAYELEENGLLNITELFFGKNTLFEFMDRKSAIGFDISMKDAFQYAGKIFNKKDEKHLFFAHFLMPHDPYVYDKNGNLNPFSKMMEETSDGIITLDTESYLEYLKFSDDKTLEFLDKIFNKKDEKPIVIILGDHGTRIIDYPPSEKYVKEAKGHYKYYFNTFLAYYNPETSPDSYLGTKSLINFAVNFQNEIFGTKLKNVEDRHFYLVRPSTLIYKMKFMEAKY